MTVDDHLQGVTLITRGEDLFHATHIHRLLQGVLGLRTPRYYHHNLIADSSGQRLAKRNRAITLRHLRDCRHTPDDDLAHDRPAPTPRPRCLIACGLALLLLLAGCMVPASAPPTSDRRAGTRPQPRAVIVALHGFNDYSAAFAEFGPTPPPKVCWSRPTTSRASARIPRGSWPGRRSWSERWIGRSIGGTPPSGLPVFVLGESMGASVAMAAMASPEPPVAGVILVAPAVWNGADLPASYRATLRMLAGHRPALRVSGRNRRQASDNIEMLRGATRSTCATRAWTGSPGWSS